MNFLTWWDKNSNIETFAEMVGNDKEKTREILRNHIIENHTSVLECGAGLCNDWYYFKEHAPHIHYNALDFTDKFVKRNKKYGIDIVNASIEDIPKSNNSYDLVYCRHVLEHLGGFKPALLEMIRVARKEVAVVFFIPPGDKEEIHINEQQLFTNTYSKKEIEEYLKLSDKVYEWKWYKEGDEELLFIKL